MKLLTLTTFFSVVVFCLQAQITDPKDTEVWFPKPQMVTSSPNTIAAPSDAIVLFDGTDTDEWEKAQAGGGNIGWTVKDGILTVKKGTGDIRTKRSFGNAQLHIEFRTPAVVVGEGQGRGNSGIFFQERYEVQVLDNYKNTTYSNGQAGAVYKQHIPLVNACRPPGEWQSYDIVFTAPIFNKDGIKTASGYLTVIHNGVIVQNHVEIKGTTEYIGLPKNNPHGEAPIKLQDHGNPVSYRNIWIRPL